MLVARLLRKKRSRSESESEMGDLVANIIPETEATYP
jgi:hypothetical protein